MINNENYITIQGWMVNDLKLKGNALIVYATIYGFSQTADCKFTGSANYLANWCGCSRQTIMTTLNKLVADSLIIKTEEFKNNVKFCSYHVNLTGCKSSLQGVVKKFDRGLSKNLTGSCQNSLHNNIDKNNRNKTIEDNMDKKNSKKSLSFSKLVIETCLKNDIENDTSIELIEQFLTEMKIKTKGSIEANIAKLAGKSTSVIERCIKTSYERNYKYITPPEWLNTQSKNKLPDELRLNSSTNTKEREEFLKKVNNDDPSLFTF